MATSGGESEKDADVPNGHPSADGDHSMELPVGVTTAAGDESEICNSGVYYVLLSKPVGRVVGLIICVQLR